MNALSKQNTHIQMIAKVNHTSFFINFFFVTNTISPVPFKPLFQMFLTTTNGEGNGTPLQYSCLENPMGRGAW